MGFEFAGTSTGNSAENHTATVTDWHIDGPSHTRRTVAWIRCARYVFQLFSKLRHTWRNQWRTVASAMERHRSLIVSLMSIPDPTPLGVIKKLATFKNPTPSFHPFPSLFLPFPSLLNFLLPTSLLYQLITSSIPQIPKIYPLLVRVCYCGSVLANQLPSLLVFLKFSGMCLWSLPIYIAFLFFFKFVLAYLFLVGLHALIQFCLT